MRPQVGQVINNKYRLLRLVGDGGMGSVYEARHEVLGTSVALKFLHAELSKREGLVQRFLQEARVSAQIQSPHVVRVTDVDQTPSGAFMVMEYVEGKTLQTLYEELYKAGRSLSPTDALEYAIQMLEGVEAAHRSGIVHRDLKPDNVMVTLDAKGRPLLKLLDFGIAKLKVSGEYDRGLTRPGVIMGTPEYMAPEQAFSAEAVDARADIFSLGVMIFEMLAGRRPVGGDDPRQIASAYLSGQIARLTDLAPEIPPGLAAAVHHAMAPLAADRWASITELRDAIEPFAVAARAPSALPPGPSRVSLNGGGSPTPGPGGAEQPSFRPDATSPATPPSMTNPPLRGPTPLGGFAAFGEEASVGPAFIPPTRSRAPLSAGRGAAMDPGATALASPMGSLEAPIFFGGTPRPSGTAISPDPRASAPQASYVPPIVPVVAPVVPRGARSAGPLSSLPAILLLATAVSAAVVGGVYIAHDRAKTDDHEDPPVPAVPSATVPADPPPPDDTPSATAAPTSAPAHPWRPSPALPSKPPSKGSVGPVVPPAPSSTATRPPPLFPSVLPPIIIPTSLPFGFPFSRPPADPPRNPPDAPPRDRPPQQPAAVRPQPGPHLQAPGDGP